MISGNRLKYQREKRREEKTLKKKISCGRIVKTDLLQQRFRDLLFIQTIDYTNTLRP